MIDVSQVALENKNLIPSYFLSRPAELTEDSVFTLQKHDRATEVSGSLFQLSVGQLRQSSIGALYATLFTHENSDTVGKQSFQPIVTIVTKDKLFHHNNPITDFTEVLKNLLSQESFDRFEQFVRYDHDGWYNGVGSAIKKSVVILTIDFIRMIGTEARQLLIFANPEGGIELLREKIEKSIFVDIRSVGTLISITVGDKDRERSFDKVIDAVDCYRYLLI